MSFTVTLFTMSSPKNSLDKSTTTLVTYNNCLIKDDTSILDPVILIRTSDTNESKAFTQANYLYIDDFARYYFISDVVSVRNNVFEIHAHVDVLTTYKAEIRANKGIIGRTANASMGDYMLEDNVVKCRANPHEVTVLFSNASPNSTDSLILVVAGNNSVVSSTSDTSTE